MDNKDIRYPFPMNINETAMQIALRKARSIKSFILAISVL